MSDMDELVAWLREQLDDDERVAQRVEPNQAPVDLRAMVTRDGSEPFLIVDSRRVLAEVDAKRRILEYAETVHERGKVGPAPGDGAWFLAVRLLALPYADRAGYRDEWRP